MGYWKNRQIEEMERGYKESNRLVCAECIGDYYLRDFVQENGSLESCEFCENENICITFQELMEPIMIGIHQEYEDANECVGWNSREGGFIGAETWDSYDFVTEILSDEIGIEDSGIIDELFEIMNDITWSQRDPYGNRPDDELFYTWENFSRALIENRSSNENDFTEIMDNIISGIRDFKLLKALNINTKIYRARFHDKNDIISSAKQLSSPEPQYANDNRMSAKGYPMFYGAFDQRTSMLEVGQITNCNLSVGSFYNQRELNIIDFSMLKSIPSISLFDVENFQMRVSLSFLRKFNKEISKPVDEQDKVNGKYRPTQILTKFLKESIRTDNDEPIDGIVYDSSVDSGERCIVIFLQNDDASDEKNRTLWFDKREIITCAYEEYLNMKNSWNLQLNNGFYGNC